MKSSDIMNIIDKNQDEAVSQLDEPGSAVTSSNIQITGDTSGESDEVLELEEPSAKKLKSVHPSHKSGSVEIALNKMAVSFEVSNKILQKDMDSEEVFNDKVLSFMEENGNFSEDNKRKLDELLSTTKELDRKLSRIEERFDQEVSVIKKSIDDIGSEMKKRIDEMFAELNNEINKKLETINQS